MGVFPSLTQSYAQHPNMVHTMWNVSKYLLMILYQSIDVLWILCHVNGGTLRGDQALNIPLNIPMPQDVPHAM